MSSALDLAGGAHTITADSTETYFTVTDSVGGGTLTIEAGALEFDDADGAGFLSGSGAFTLTCTGTSTAWVTISSVESYPNHRWTLPPSGTAVTATRTQWRDYTGSFATTWILNNPSYITDAYVYATIEELQNLTGTGLADDPIMEILAHSTRRINTRLGNSGITVSVAGDRTLQSICLDFAHAQVLGRYIADGTAVGGANVDGVPTQGELLGLMKYYDKRGESELQMYVDANRPTTHSQYYVYKVNG